MLMCVCILGMVGPLLAQDQYESFSEQTFSIGEAFPGQSFPSNQPYSGEASSAAVPAYSQPLTSTNYKVDGHQRFESVDGQGNLKGEYSYVDPNGKTITVKYTAGKEGYQVQGDNVQQPPAEPAQPQQYQAQSQQFPAVPQYQPQQYQAQPEYQTQYQLQPQQYQAQPEYQTEAQYQYQPQTQQYQAQPDYQTQLQQYQPEPQYEPEPQYQTQPYQSQPQFETQPQSQPSFEFSGFPQNRFGSPSIPPGVTVNQNQNGGFTYSYSPVETQQH